MVTNEMRRLPAAVGGVVAGALFALSGSLAAQEVERPPVVVAFTLDTSGSIGAQDLARTRELALALLAALPAGGQVAVFSFDDQSRVVVPRTSDPDAVRRALGEIKLAGRFTALHDALYDASRYLRDAPEARKAIVLVTDGKDEGSALNLDDGLQVAKDSGIPVFAVGVGKAQERVMRRIAKLTAGEYFDIAHAKGPDLAGRIEALQGPSPSPALGAPATPVPAPVAVAVSRPAKSKGRAALWLLLLGGGFLALALLLAALARRGKPPASSLSVGSGEPPAASGPTSLDTDEVEEDDAYSPTVIGRMDMTEEFLEKTVTLAEKPILLVQGGPRNGEIYILNKQATTSMGRARANDIVLDDVSVSSQHCRIRYDGQGFVLHDLKSTNGTYVNDQRVARHSLKSGDVIKLGETALQFKLDQRKG